MSIFDLATITYSGGIITLYATRVEYDWNKQLFSFTPPTSRNNRSAGPKDTRIIDLLRIERRLSIRGFVDEADRYRLIAAQEAGGIVGFSWDNLVWVVNIQKLTLVKDANREDDHWDFVMTMVLGVDM